MNLLLVAVPRYGAYMMTLTGILLVGTNIGYYMMLPSRPLTIIIEGGRLEFHLGWCFWLVAIAGILCLCLGFIISAIDLLWPHTFSTILEVYYDTPYDRHVILEESHDARYRKRNSKGLEEPPGLGSRILRRLSSKTKEQNTAAAGGVAGVDNRGFQNDVPKSPWRYPFRRAQNLPPQHPNGLQRTVSQDSGSSIASASRTPSIRKPNLTRILP